MENDDVRDLIAEEKSRGRRKYDPEERRERRELLKAYRKLLEETTEVQFKEMLRQRGLRDDSPAFQDALAAWRETQNELKSLKSSKQRR